MVTLLFRRVDNVVAAVPILILAISPTASLSASVSVIVVGAAVVVAAPAAPAAPVNASISSCDNIPSIYLLLLPYH